MHIQKIYIWNIQLCRFIYSYINNEKIWKDSYYNLLLSVGNWWEGSAAPEEWSDDEVYGAEAGASIKTMLLHWKT